MKGFRGLLCAGAGAVLLYLLWETEAVRAAVTEALTLCTGSLIPALFPFLVVSGLLVSLGVGELLAPSLAGVTERLFRLPGTAGTAVLLGLVGGYPVGAKTAADLYRTGRLTKEETHRLLTFCNNANPAFFLGVLGAGVFRSSRTGLWLWLIHVLSALLTGILSGRKSPSPVREGFLPYIGLNTSFTAAFTASVAAAVQSMLSVCAFVTVFYVLTRPLTVLPGLWGAAAVGCTELFSLIPLLQSSPAGFLLAAGCSGWGGLSVLCQTAAILEGTGLSAAPCARGKALQGLFSLLLAAGLLAAGWV